uniref:DUF413 domain-containing protein n=1 Tax=Thaumasiovibrio occultus TaxID=1891184 RepID=UPI000B34F027|nr:DUF413 domain-containing protein [Thaumasiovibrio occultus]
MRTEGFFIDNKSFPRGFGKSGNFTIAESRQLEVYGNVMRLLTEGSYLPADDEEVAFLDQIQGNAPLTSPLARVWLKYQALTTQRRRTYTLCSSPRSGSEQLAGSEDFDMTD